jgi:hypothetical protein
MLLQSTIIAAADAELEDLGANRATLVGLTQLGTGTVSDLLNGVRPATHEQAQLIYRWLSGLRKYVEACRPIPVNFKEIALLQKQIEALEKGTLQINVVLQEPSQERPKLYSIRLKTGSYFTHLDPGINVKQVIGTFNFIQSAVFTKEAGERAIGALEALGQTGCRLIENRFTSQGVNDDLEMVGL